MDLEQRLQDLGITLPSPPTPVAAYVPVVQTGNLCFVSGQLPIAPDQPLITGAVPEDCSVEVATAAARQCAINILAQLKAHLGSLDRIKRFIRLDVFVHSSPGFIDHSKVANGASDFLVVVFGNAGKHSRTAVGATELPLGATVEIAAIVEVA